MQATGRLRRSAGVLCTVAELAAIALVIWWMGSRAHAFTGTPKGYDASGHLSKARFILDNWPHVSWNYEWYSGQPSFIGSYPPGYHVLLALITWASGAKLATSMNIVTYCSVLLVVIGLHATVRAATGSRLAGLASAGLLLGTPSLWAQMVVLGLYPRFAALAPMSLALAAAVAHSRRGGRHRAVAASVLLALSLSIHPIVGMIGVGLVGGVYLLDPRRTGVARLVTLVGVLAGSFGLSAYFYLPLALTKRSQSALTDSEVSLSWHMLFTHGPQSLDGLTPVLLVLALLLAGYAARTLLPPAVPFEEKVLLGRDVTFLTPGVHDEVPAAAGPATRRYARWRQAFPSTALPYRMSLLFVVSSLAVFGYGLIGLVVSHFPYYINGLQPTDLLVYPAFLLSGVVGLVLPSTVRGLTARLRPGRRVRFVRHTVLPLAVLAAAVLVLWPSMRATSHALLPDEKQNDWVAQVAPALPAESAGQFQYRFAGAADVSSKWVNEYSGVPQVRGYDDHGALHLDWQVWLESSLLHKSSPQTERAFLLDWYGVKWANADSGTGNLAPFDDDPADFVPVASAAQPGVRIQTYRYAHASPILSASAAPTVLVVGDAQHYDLFLRALGLSGVASSQLVPVRGPASLDDVTPAMLRSFDSVVLYGAGVGHAARDAAILRTYVTSGGGLFVDASANSAGVDALARQRNSPLAVTSMKTTVVQDGGWAWTSSGDPSVTVDELGLFGPPAYAQSNAWSTQTATAMQSWASAVLQTGGKTVVSAGTLGRGRVVWEGLNLPYHVDVFRSVPEAGFLERLVESTAGRPAAAPAGTVALLDAEHWRISGVTTRGVLFKEQGFGDWQASVDGRRAVIYPAGPGMMWISLAGHGPGPATVDLTYRLSAVERLGYLVAILTLLAMAGLLASARLWRLVVRAAGRVSGAGDQPLTYRIPQQRTPAAPVAEPAPGR